MADKECPDDYQEVGCRDVVSYRMPTSKSWAAYEPPPDREGKSLSQSAHAWSRPTETTMKIRLNSSAITAVEYDSATGRMKIWFPANGPYSFHRVPERIYLGLVNAGSKGTYYHNHIQGRYQA